MKVRMICISTNFYPRSPCGERLNIRQIQKIENGISIHALLAESDKMHALILANTMLFLSTLSLRRATGNKCCKGSNDSDFYPRSPCGERRASNQTARPKQRISIHALLAESDNPPSITPTASRNFYPRSPCGERRSHYRSSGPFKRFLSTLSLRRATLPTDGLFFINGHFYPRSPCGERLINNVINGINKIFLSTLSLRRATVNEITYQRQINQFLSTLSLRRATVAPVLAVGRAGYFYPRSPCGERQVGQKRFLQKLAISIHALLAESDNILCMVNI